MTTPPAHNTPRVARHALTALVGAAATLGLAACRGERSDTPPRQFFPDMDDQPKFRPQSATPFFEDGRVMRPRVANTIAFGHGTDPADAGRTDFLKDDPALYAGIDASRPPAQDGTPAYLAAMPPEAIDLFARSAAQRGQTVNTSDREAALQAMIQRGQERFNITCALCHGYHGEGGDPTNLVGGPVGRRWGYVVPTFHDAKYQDRSVYTGQDGYLYHVILNGVPDLPGKPHKMPPYADKVSPADAWAIVTYVRTLQASRVESLDQVPAEAREALRQSAPRVAAPASPAPRPSAPSAPAPPVPPAPAPGTPEAHP